MVRTYTDRVNDMGADGHRSGTARHELDSRALMLRAYRALGPVAAGLVLDFVDLVTFGPLGLVAGPIVGVTVGWWLSSFFRISTASRVALTALATLYVTFPLTEAFPLATFLCAAAAFLENPETEAGPARRPESRRP